MVLSCQQMREAEEAAFARGVSAAHLMDEAGHGIAETVREFFPVPGNVILYLGKGNNAGDALVAARHLANAGWKVYARLACDPADFRELPALHWSALAQRICVATSSVEIEALRGNIILLDGLVGIGAKVPLHGALAKLAREMNAVRRQRHATLIALDLPSGLDPESGKPTEPCVEADITITIGHVKNALLADAATRSVGRIAVVPLAELDDAQGDTTCRALTAHDLIPVLPPRCFEFHKGEAGRVGIIAGSKGFLGAADLASRGALHGGAGLVTLYVKEEIYPLISVRTAPEIMVKCVSDYREVLRDKLDVLAIGPGIGVENEDEILAVIACANFPAVLDADALNMIARRGFDCLEKNSALRLLTPHPGEFARLAEHAPEWKSMSRRAAAEAFAAKFLYATLLLKGSRTVIAAAGKPTAFNTTGHPGMATGGVGDVLTGVCSALIAQGLSVYDAACLGSWINGRAAELALRDGIASAESLSAGLIVEKLGAAFNDLRTI